ncbi:MAG: hypothetical protein IH819_09180 [Bacteroidetes bacterium]|nr:hypothetical protein [Bacteroidota bacterium]
MIRTNSKPWLQLDKLSAGIVILIISTIGCIQETKNEIDPVKVSPDKFTVLLANEHVRVVEYTLLPGENDNWHTHLPKTSYIISGGKLKTVLENGEEFSVEEKTGSASWMDNIGKHYAENIGNTKVIVLLTEIKSLE